AAPSETRAGEWAVADSVRAFSVGDYLEFTAPYAFGALGAHWSAGGDPDLHLAVSASADGITWGPWQDLHTGAHGPAPDQATGRTDRFFAELLLLPPSRVVRCYATDHNGNPASLPPDLRLVYIDASAGPQATATAPVVTALTADKPTIVPRAGW